MTMVDEPERCAHILLVEDNRGDALLARRAFKRGKAANEVTVAESGEEGLRMLRREAAYAGAPGPDIILLDLNLPRMHGHEFLTTVKDDPDLRQIPVIVLSSSKAGNDVTTSYRRHANGYISKPLSPDAYDDIVARIEDYWFSLVMLPTAGSPPTLSQG